MKGNDIPAFPCIRQNTTGTFYPEGMTLRDYFAGQALIGLLASYSTKERISSVVDNAKKNGYLDIANYTSSSCYQIADAMLAERSKNDKS